MIRLTLAGVIAKSSNIGTVLAADKFDAGELRGYLVEVRPRPAHRRRRARRDAAASCPTASQWTRPDRGPDRLRPVALGQRRADDRRGQHARQRRRPRRPERDQGPGHDATTASGSAPTRPPPTGSSAPDAARATTHMMERVVDPEVGVAPGAQIPGYRVAGKTGTAQRVGECQCYDGTFTVSFAGFAPADDPRFTVYVVVQNPRNGGGGGSVGARRSPRSWATPCAATRCRRRGPSPPGSRSSGERRGRLHARCPRPAAATGSVASPRGERRSARGDPPATTLAHGPRRPGDLAGGGGRHARDLRRARRHRRHRPLAELAADPARRRVRRPARRPRPRRRLRPGRARRRRGRDPHRPVRRRPAPRRTACRCWSSSDPARCSAGWPRACTATPRPAMRMIGVTGTQGKTTTTRLAEGGLQQAGVPAGRGRHRRHPRGRARTSGPRSPPPRRPTCTALFAMMRERGGRRLRDGGLQPRAGHGPRGRRGLRRRRVHQPRPRPPRLPRRRRGVLRRQGVAVHARAGPRSAWSTWTTRTAAGWPRRRRSRSAPSR